MRSSLLLLASLVGSSLAYPANDLSVDRRTFGLGADILGSAVVDIGGLLDAVLGVDVHSTTSLLTGLGANGAAALEGGALGCKSSVIHASARKELKAWLATQVHIKGALFKKLDAWCDGSTATLEGDVLAALAVYIPGCAEIAAKESIYVTVDGILSASDLEASLVLSGHLQTSLTSFLHATVGLDVNVKAGLKACAAGGLVGSLHADVKAGLLSWLNGKDCSLDVDLKAAVLAWVNGKSHSGLVAAGHLSADALSAISVGASVGASVQEGGALSASAQASIGAFLKADVSVDLDVNVKKGLEACAGGKLATSLDVDVRTDLAVWLSGSKCGLGVELKAVVLLWLSLATTAEASLDLVGGLLVDITGFLSETVIAALSINLRGALGLLAGGESLSVLSWETRAELAAFLGGCTSIDIGVSIEVIIVEWFTGCKIPGAPAPSSSAPGLPSSTPTVVPSIPLGPSKTKTHPAPTGPAPTGPAPSGPSGPAPSGPASSGPAPSGPAPSGPSGPAPSGPTGPAPSGPAPSGPASSGPAPSGPAPSGPSGPAPSGPSGPAPSGSSPVGPAPSGPAPSGPAQSGPSHGPTGPAPTGPAPTGPSGPAPSGSSPVGPAPSGPAESGPAPSSSAGGSGGSGGNGPAPTGPAGPSGSSPVGPAPSGSSPAGPAPSSSAGGSGGSGGNGGNGSSPAPPATTQPPSPSGGAGSPGDSTTTVTHIHTVCNCTESQ